MSELNNLKQALNDCENDLPAKFEILHRHASELGFKFKANFSLFAYRRKKPSKEFFVMDILMECEKNGADKSDAKQMKQGIIHMLTQSGLESDFVPVTAKPKDRINGNSNVQENEPLDHIPDLSGVVRH